MGIDRYGIQIGPIELRFYGLIIMLGVIVATQIAAREAKRKGLDPNFLFDNLVSVVIAGIIGARLWHILTPPPSMVESGVTTYYYFTHPLDAIAIWRGGLGIPGAVIGGVLALLMAARKNEQDFLTWSDVVAPVLPLAQAIGRWGNYINQEVYGAPTNLPWAIAIDPEHRLPDFANYATYHPLFLYEGIWNLASAFFLLWLARRHGEKLLRGDLFLIYLMTYPFIRFWLDFIRLDASEINGINANQTFMAVIFVISLLVFIFRHLKAKQKTANA